MKSYGELLKHCRKKDGKSQQSLSAQTGVSQRYISYLETNKSRPSRTMVRLLADSVCANKVEKSRMFLFAGYIEDEEVEGDASLSPLPENIIESLCLIVDSFNSTPSVLVDSYWNIYHSNKGFLSLLSRPSFDQEITRMARFNGLINFIKLLCLVDREMPAARYLVELLSRSVDQGSDVRELSQLREEIEKFKSDKEWHWVNESCVLPALQFPDKQSPLNFGCLMNSFGNGRYTNQKWTVITLSPLDHETLSMI